MTQEDPNRLRTDILATVSNLDHLQEAELLNGSKTASFYWFPSPENRQVIIKVFTGETAGRLFRQEFTAFSDLKITNRVCEVVADSMRHDAGFWDEKFQGPFFIAKPYYTKQLDSALKNTTGLERLDIAAQEIDIARTFLKLGWRDFDWRKENDVIESSGKILRVDLDCASALNGFFEEKSTTTDNRFFTLTEQNILQGFSAYRDSIVRGSDEVRNMAIRLANLIFIGDNESADLKNAIIKFQGIGCTKTKGSASLGTREGWLNSVLAFVEKVGRGPQRDRRRGHGMSLRLNDSPDDKEHTEFDFWVEIWLRQSAVKSHGRPATPASLARLTKDELGLLARLFHYLISTPESGFTLDDFHTSLVMIAVDSLKSRAEQLRECKVSESELVKVLSPNTKFFELRRALFSQTNGVPARNADEQKTSSAKPPKNPVSKLAINCWSGKGYWASTMKELGRKCEDRAVVLTDPFHVVAVVDGVSEASGFEAAEIVIKNLTEWHKKSKTVEPEEMKKKVQEFFLDTNTLLVDSFHATKKYHQAMLILTVLCTVNDTHWVMVAKAGDSDCQVFSPNGNSRLNTKSWMGTRRLGDLEKFDESSMRVEHYVLNKTGKYRIRLFSDGVGELAQQRIREVEDISDLVDEARNWPDSLKDSVGQDDWSVAGIDVVVEEMAPSSAKPKTEESKKPTDDIPEESESVVPLWTIIDAKASAFTLSKPAMEFWETALNSSENTTNHRLIGEVVKFKSSPKQPQTRAGRQNERDEEWSVGWIVFIVVLTVSAAVGFFYLTISILNSPLLNLTPKPSDIAKATPPQADPTPDLSEKQKSIYGELQEKGFYIQDKLPSGSGIEDPAVQEFLKI